MTTNDAWRRYLEAGAAVGQVTLARAEEIAKGLVAPGPAEREAAWREFEQLTRFGRRIGEQLVETARAEVSRQLEVLGAGSLEQFRERFSEFLGSPSAERPSHAGRVNDEPESSEPPPTSIEPGAGSAAATETSPRHRGGKKAKSNKNQNKRAKKDKKDEKDKRRRQKVPEAAKLERRAQKHGPVKEMRRGRVLTMTQPPGSSGSL